MLVIVVTGVAVWVRRNRLASGQSVPREAQWPEGNVDRVALSPAAYAAAAGAEYEDDEGDGEEDDGEREEKSA